MPHADDDGGGRVAVTQECLDVLDELLDLPPLLRPSDFRSDVLKVFAYLLFGIAEAFGDERGGNNIDPFVEKLLQQFQVDWVTAQLIERVSLHLPIGGIVLPIPGIAYSKGFARVNT